jgi:L-asparaginase
MDLGSVRHLPVVAIITTGGTIAEKKDPATGAAVPALSGTELIQAIPELRRVAAIRVVSFSNIDSAMMDPRRWAKLSRKVDQVLADPDIAGAVVTHGTDTMVEGAYFLDLTLKTDKPVVLVGSMRDASTLSPDGPGNILNAVLQVCSPEARDWGVTITLNQYINSARNARKTQTTNVQSFDSGEEGYLGYIVNSRVIRFNDRPCRLRLPLPAKLPKVVLITTYSGDDGQLIRGAAAGGAAGIVLECLGAGNVNPATFQAVKAVIARGIPVVITTRVENGGVYPLYGAPGGGYSLQAAGAILAGNLKGPRARILLTLALPQTKNDREKLRTYFH